MKTIAGSSCRRSARQMSATGMLMRGILLSASACLAAPAAAQSTDSMPAQQERVLGLYAVKIVVADFQRSIDFYSVLGLSAGRKVNAAEWRLDWQGRRQGSDVIMLLADQSARLGGSYLMFSVESVAQTVAALQKAGASEIGAPHDLGRAVILLLKDPDGNTIELVGPSEPRKP